MTGHVQAGHAVNDGVAVAVRCRAALTGRCGGADGEVSSGFGYQGAAGVCRAADDVDVLGAQAGGAEAVFALLCRFPVAGDDASDEAGVAFCVDVKACCVLGCFVFKLTQKTIFQPSSLATILTKSTGPSRCNNC